MWVETYEHEWVNLNNVELLRVCKSGEDTYIVRAILRSQQSVDIARCPRKTDAEYIASFIAMGPIDTGATSFLYNAEDDSYDAQYLADLYNTHAYINRNYTPEFMKEAMEKWCGKNQTAQL